MTNHADLIAALRIPMDVTLPGAPELDVYDEQRKAAADRIEELTAERDALVALLREANADLKSYINTDWPERMRNQYPDMQRRWKRDMELCHRIDAALRPSDQGERR